MNDSHRGKKVLARSLFLSFIIIIRELERNKRKKQNPKIQCIV